MKLLIIGILAVVTVIGVYAEETSSVAPTTSPSASSSPSATTDASGTSSSSEATSATSSTTASSEATPVTSSTTVSSTPETTTTTTTAAKLERTTTKPDGAPSTKVPTNGARGVYRGAKKYQPGHELGNEVMAKRFESKSNHDTRSYKFAYETEDGQKRDEQVDVERLGKEDENLVVKGHYSFIAADGYEYLFSYIADDKGFRPVITVRKVEKR